MKTIVRPLILLGLMAAASLACSGFSDILQNTPASSGFSSNVLFQDDFSDAGSGWNTLEDAGSRVSYLDGKLNFTIDSEQTDVWSNPDLSFGDVHVVVTATKNSGTDDNDFGIICRYQDENNFYGLLISSDGYYGITKMKDGNHELLGTSELAYSETIRRGAAANQVEADCIGDTLTLTVNGDKMLEEKDAEFTTGDVGLIAGTFATPGTDISFDNFVVTQP
ncbi:MAG: hypothetical protein M1281_08375 [Chloroflexi bacterium]|nr:hypothetical protein [Chloroflexota bacterium]